ncbi:hypothetical protein D3C81_1704400 [compost metagenome]
MILVRQEGRRQIDKNEIGPGKASDNTGEWYKPVFHKKADDFAVTGAGLFHKPGKPCQWATLETAITTPEQERGQSRAKGQSDDGRNNKRG